MTAERVYLKDIPHDLRSNIANELIDVWFYEGIDCYFLMSHSNADQAVKLIEANKLLGEKAPDVDYAVLGAKKLMSDMVGNKQ